ADIALGETTVCGPDSPADFEVAYQLQFDDQTLAPVCFGASSTLLSLLAPSIAQQQESPAPEPPSASPSNSRVHRTIPPDVSGDDDLGRVLALELPIRVSFGTANVALKEVLKLSTGPIAVLARSIPDHGA